MSLLNNLKPHSWKVGIIDLVNKHYTTDGDENITELIIEPWSKKDKYRRFFKGK